MAMSLQRLGDFKQKSAKWSWLAKLRSIKYRFSFLALWVTALSVFPNFVLSGLMTLLTEDLKLSTTNAAEMVNVSDGLTGIFAIVGAILVDAYLTPLGIIFFSSLFYLLGLITLVISRHVSFVWWSVGIGLFLIAVGKSSLTNSIGYLAEEENRSKKPKEGNRLERHIMFVLEVVVVVVLFFSSSSEMEDEEYDYSNGSYPPRPSPIPSPRPSQIPFPHPSQIPFIISAILMFLVTVVSLFYLKIKSFIKRIEERATPLKSIPYVYAAAIMKKRLPSPKDLNELYEENPEHKLEHTNSYRFLDKAAIKETPQPEKERKRFLCTVTEVEECKRLLRMSPMCITFVAYGMVKSIGNTFFLEQGNQMDATIGNKDIPLPAFLYLADLSSFMTKRLYTKFIKEKLKGPGEKYDPIIAYAMGMVLCTLCCTVASWVAMEIFNRSEEKSKPELSVFWLTPQFVIFGAMDGLAYDGIEEFFSAQLPPSMKRYASVFTEAMVGVGSLFAIFLVLITQVATHWFPDEKEPGNNRLDRFYHLSTVVATIIFFAYAFAAVRYRHQENHETREENQSQVLNGNEQAPEHRIGIEVQNSQQEEENEGLKQQLPPADESTKESNQEEKYYDVQPLLPAAASTRSACLPKEET